MRACLKLYLDKTYTFEYNVGGNIVSKNEYVYTEGELGTPTKTYAYAYANGWNHSKILYLFQRRYRRL